MLVIEVGLRREEEEEGVSMRKWVSEKLNEIRERRWVVCEVPKKREENEGSLLKSARRDCERKKRKVERIEASSVRW